MEGLKKIRLRDWNLEIGKKYSRLTVLQAIKKEDSFGRNVPYFICLCDCGTTKTIMAQNIVKGRTKSCGCLEKESRHYRIHRKEDITGQLFGRLTVIEETKERASNNSILWKCRCECGNSILATHTELKLGRKESCGCSKIHGNTLDRTGKTFGNLKVVTIDREMSKKRGRVFWKCRCLCGNTVSVSSSDLETGNTLSCGCTAMKFGETYISKILSNEKIEYVPQKRFSDCRDIKPLPFDFYLPGYATAIEYDGRQHFEVVECWGGASSLIRTQTHDKIKNDYCKAKGIKLIRIPYTKSTDEISDIIKSLNPVTSK